MARQTYFKTFFNPDYQVASTANAANLIARAGATQGQMFANLGKIAGDTLEKFRKNKEEKETQEEFIRMGKTLPLETFAPFGVKSEEERDALLQGFSKNPESRQNATFLAQLSEQARARRGQEEFTNIFLGGGPTYTDDYGTHSVETGDSVPNPFMDRPSDVIRMLETSGRMPKTPEGRDQLVQFLQGRGKEVSDRDLDERRVKLEERRVDLEEQSLKKAGRMPVLTTGEKARDDAFGKELDDFNLQDVNKGLIQLKEALQALESSDNLTGAFIGSLPDWLKERTYPEAVSVQEKVEEVVQRNFRLVLGSAFTEEEAESFLSRAYNPNLTEKENADRVRRLINSIEGKRDEMLRKRKFFEEEGTLKGYVSGDEAPPAGDESSTAPSGEQEASPESLQRLDDLERLMKERQGR